MDGPEIHYSVVAPGRFRLWTDPATPATDLLPAGRIDAPKPTTAAWSEGKWWLELDLSQVPPQFLLFYPRSQTHKPAFEGPEPLGIRHCELLNCIRGAHANQFVLMAQAAY